MKLKKPLFFGVCIGLIISSIFLLPWLYRYHIKLKIESRHQDKLMDASGLAFDSFHTYPVGMTVLYDGVPLEGMSASADGYRWFTPRGGKIKLELTEGKYEYKAAYQNQLLAIEGSVLPNDENRIELDMKNAPHAPEIVFHTLRYGENGVFPLDIENADEVKLENALNGVNIKNNNGKFSFVAEDTFQRYGFYHFTLVSINPAGSAATEFCLTVPRETDPIIITTVKELAAVKNNLAGNYILANDLDFTAVTDWSVIGTPEYPFIGTFDGGGYTITGLSGTGNVDHACIFSSCKNAVIKNVIVRDTLIDCEPPEVNFGYAALAVGVDNCYIENCASIGGSIKVTSGGSAGGLICSSINSVIIGCFNSIDVTCNTPSNDLPNTGGIVGWFDGYIQRCANEGDITSLHLVGGIVGFLNVGTVTQTWSTGKINGHPLVGEYPPGSIMHTTNNGARGSYSYFLKGVSAAGRAFSMATVIDMKPMDKIAFRDKNCMPSIGTFGGENPDWVYASLDAYGPVPFGIFKKQMTPPTISADGSNIKVSPVDGVQYYYSTDGSDPYITCLQSVDSIALTLKKGQTLKIFSAKSGLRDSEIIEYRESEVRR